MINLWIFMACVTGVTLVAMLLPLFTRKGEALADRAEFDLAVYRDQLKEIDADLERGLLDASQAEAARTEIQRRMLAAAPAEGKATPTPGQGRDWLLVGAIAVAVPLAAIALYGKLGAPGQPDQPLASRSLGQERVADRKAEMEKLVSQLSERLKRNPDDLKGWIVLARSLDGMGRSAEAIEAYRKAVALSNRRADLLGDLAEALIQQGEDSIPEEARALLEEARGKDPEDPRPYFYGGAVLAQKGDLKGAIQQWTDLVAVSPADAPWVPQVKQSIAAAAKKLGIDPESVKPAVQGAAPKAAAQPDPAEMSPEEQREFIRQMVERLEQRLQENPGDKEGWQRLGRAYEVLGETAKSLAAYRKARTLEK